MSINCSVNNTGYSAYQLVFVTKMKFPIDFIFGNPEKEETISKYILKLQNKLCQIYQEARLQQKVIHERQKEIMISKVINMNTKLMIWFG